MEAEISPNVGSRRTTKIGNLVVLAVFLVALIICYVLLVHKQIFLLQKERVRMRPGRKAYFRVFLHYVTLSVKSRCIVRKIRLLLAESVTCYEK